MSTTDRSSRKGQPWSPTEEEKVVNTIKENPQNLSKCFLILSTELHRSRSSIANRWYSKISKDPEVLCFFTATPKYISKNRKNGVGINCTSTIWRRLVSIISRLFS